MRPIEYFILQHTGNGAGVLHRFDTEEARDAKTKELIYGEDELCPNDQRGLSLYLEELRDTGSIEFEGDPGLEWFNAFKE